MSELYFACWCHCLSCSVSLLPGLSTRILDITYSRFASRDFCDLLTGVGQWAVPPDKRTGKVVASSEPHS